MTNVRRLVFEATYRTEAIRLGREKELYLDPVGYVWDTLDPQVLGDKAWLDAHAPGWRSYLLIGEPRKLTLPFGLALSGTFLSCEVVLRFVCAAHRDAWNLRAQERLDEVRRGRERYEAAVAAHGQDAVICETCAVPMPAFTKQQTERLSQFAFVFEVRANRCPCCGSESYPLCDHAELSRALEEADSRIGLPRLEDTDWDERIVAERRRRRVAPPEITVQVARTDTAEDILGKLDAELARAGVPPRGHRPRLVVSHAIPQAAAQMQA